MISKSKNFIFIHVPKTGGNSIQSALLAYSDDTLTSYGAHQDGKERFGLENADLGTQKHSTLKTYRQALSRSNYQNFFKFSILRNPWDKLISMYFSPHTGRETWNKSEFIRLIKDVPSISHYLETKGKSFPWIRSKPKHILSEVDLLLSFENLDNDFYALCQRLDMPYQKLEKRNASSRGRYQDYYDNELIKLVAKKHHVEIELGGYSFDKP